MTTRAILVNFHRYTPFGKEFYEPILDFFLQTMKKYSDEYDKVYLLDSNWEIDLFMKSKVYNVASKEWNVEIIRTDPAKRYWDAFKEALPQVKEDLVLFLDNDQIVYKPGIIDQAFKFLTTGLQINDTKEHRVYDVVSITDTIGTMKVPLETGNKLTPYFFATRKDLLMKYLDIDWGPDAMPYTETFGLLTEALLKDGARVYEMEDDKSNILFDGTKDGDKAKDFGYYHIRSGSLPAYLLSTKYEGNLTTYNEYLVNQPKSEYLRQFAFYYIMLVETKSKIDITDFLKDVGVPLNEWWNYIKEFRAYHGL